MIPKFIHYCWFGENKKSKLVEKYIKTWTKNYPDYQIIEWNEKNFDIHTNKYVEEAYNAKKYAFVSDYARLNALYNYGGIYFDTDVEVIKNMNDFLDKGKDIYCFELENKIMTGVMVSQKKSNIIKEFLNSYTDRSFIKKDGTLDLLPNTNILTDILVKKGTKLNNQLQEFSSFIVLPIEYLSAFDLKNLCKIPTNNTRCIHHCAFSWALPKEKIVATVKKKLSKILGRKAYNKLRCFFKRSDIFK